MTKLDKKEEKAIFRAARILKEKYGSLVIRVENKLIKIQTVIIKSIGCRQLILSPTPCSAGKHGILIHKS
ncbi:MAG: hypothetical protein DRI57_00975 [Deltaproteobacteria bacterium]|nr:MAG: hypothetical protein DRI57_00975 [Deltaproteobacteria bacterium]